MISVDSLTKVYGHRVAAWRVSFEVAAGEVHSGSEIVLPDGGGARRARLAAAKARGVGCQ